MKFKIQSPEGQEVLAALITLARKNDGSLQLSEAWEEIPSRVSGEISSSDITEILQAYTSDSQFCDPQDGKVICIFMDEGDGWYHLSADDETCEALLGKAGSYVTPNSIPGDNVFTRKEVQPDAAEDAAARAVNFRNEAGAARNKAAVDSRTADTLFLLHETQETTGEPDYFSNESNRMMEQASDEALYGLMESGDEQSADFNSERSGNFSGNAENADNFMAYNAIKESEGQSHEGLITAAEQEQNRINEQDRISAENFSQSMTAESGADEAVSDADVTVVLEDPEDFLEASERSDERPEDFVEATDRSISLADSENADDDPVFIENAISIEQNFNADSDLLSQRENVRAGTDAEAESFAENQASAMSAAEEETAFDNRQTLVREAGYSDGEASFDPVQGKYSDGVRVFGLDGDEKSAWHCVQNSAENQTVQKSGSSVMKSGDSGNSDLNFDPLQGKYTDKIRVYGLDGDEKSAWLCGQDTTEPMQDSGFSDTASAEYSSEDRKVQRKLDRKTDSADGRMEQLKRKTADHDRQIRRDSSDKKVIDRSERKISRLQNRNDNVQIR